ncbi:GspE/PulE family protein [Acidocella aminolytica]|jgi:general secretion pathway protein E|uniref:Secretion system type II kinase GspE n=3 Tax=Acidocella TaxID=50709 RepID=A0A0D6PEX1_9PROT|nr:GspE/PulE family protein [Acidocella aminolytica]GAN79409.1 secretion system type II kinase GspE [Acidocella aminolytica 101 = DSM 11237]
MDVPASHSASSTESILNFLAAEGACDSMALERARAVAREARISPAQALVQLGLVSERVLAESWSRVLNLPLAGPERYPDSPLLPERLRSRFLRAARCLPVALETSPDGATTLSLAMANPQDEFAACAIGLACGARINREVATPIELEAALTRLYPEEERDNSPQDADITVEDDTERLKDMASEAPVIRLVNQIIGRAVESMASDIHVEPFEDRVRIRYRYDGDLQDAETQPARLAPAIISRLKILAKLDIAERRLPQDGRIRIAVRGQEVVFRIATAPSLHGEIVVMRILDRSSVTFDFAAQGHDEQVITRLRTALAAPNGILLVTGPTGSGKTTTLYTALLSLNAEETKIITVEDPIEYQLPGINQIQVKPQIGLDFATLLRSIVRLDPNIIMVGEIRDLETAEIAARAALTGHLVLSTLHTNSAAAAITRLRDMGMEDYLIAAVLRGILAQRLVRRLCEDCKTPMETPAEFRTRYNIKADTIFRPHGCPACRNTGYRGRQAIAEFLTPDAEIERLLFAKADQSAIERAAIQAEMKTMLITGMEAVARGDTTVEEILRAVRADD